MANPIVCSASGVIELTREQMNPDERARVFVAPGRPKLAEQTASRIEQRIWAEQLQAGDLIGSESDLVTTYGVSRPVLREAIRLLEHLNVAEMRKGPGGGFFVAMPDSAGVTRAAAAYLNAIGVDYESIFEARRKLEVIAVELACERISEKGLMDLRAELALEQNAIDDNTGSAMHEIHIEIAKITRNPAISLFVEVMSELLFRRYDPDRLEGTSERGQADRRRTHEEHEAIVEAIAAGDTGMARVRMTQHLANLAGRAT